MSFKETLKRLIPDINTNARKFGEAWEQARTLANELNTVNSISELSEGSRRQLSVYLDIESNSSVAQIEAKILELEARSAADQEFLETGSFPGTRQDADVPRGDAGRTPLTETAETAPPRAPDPETAASTADEAADAPRDTRTPEQRTIDEANARRAVAEADMTEDARDRARARENGDGGNTPPRDPDGGSGPNGPNPPNPPRPTRSPGERVRDWTIAIIGGTALTGSLFEIPRQMLKINDPNSSLIDGVASAFVPILGLLEQFGTITGADDGLSYQSDQYVWQIQVASQRRAAQQLNLVMGQITSNQPYDIYLVAALNKVYSSQYPFLMGQDGKSPVGVSGIHFIRLINLPEKYHDDILMNVAFETPLPPELIEMGITPEYLRGTETLRGVQMLAQVQLEGTSNNPPTADQVSMSSGLRDNPRAYVMYTLSVNPPLPLKSEAINEQISSLYTESDTSAYEALLRIAGVTSTEALNQLLGDPSQQAALQARGLNFNADQTFRMMPWMQNKADMLRELESVGLTSDMVETLGTLFDQYAGSDGNKVSMSAIEARGFSQAIDSANLSFYGQPLNGTIKRTLGLE